MASATTVVARWVVGTMSAMSSIIAGRIVGAAARGRRGIVSAAGLTNMASRVVASATLANMIGRIVGTAPRRGRTRGHCHRRGGQQHHRNLGQESHSCLLLPKPALLWA